MSSCDSVYKKCIHLVYNNTLSVYTCQVFFSGGIYMPSQLPKIVARTDQTTIKKIKIIAAENERSVSQEMVYLVKQEIKRYEKEKGEIIIEQDETSN